MTVAELPPAIVPSEQATGLVALQVPWLGVAETSVKPDGRVSDTLTLVAAALPELATVIVQLMFWPMPTSADPPPVTALEIVTSASHPVTLPLTELLSGVIVWPRPRMLAKVPCEPKDPVAVFV